MRPLILIASIASLGACVPEIPDLRDPFNDPITPFAVETTIHRGEGPPDADPNACYGLHTRPAVIETVTEQVMVTPPELAPDGTVARSGVFQTETRQRIVEERQQIWFETPCQLDRDPEFIAALQRALQARGLYRGPINGEMTRRTLRAVQAFQAPQGLDSPVLSLAAARQLGLSLWDPDLAASGGG
jgi:hypothetical protein